MSEFAIKLIEEEKKKKTGKLNLGNCGLRNIPKELFELYWLEELSFRNSFLDIITGAEIIDNNLSNQNFLDLEVLPPDFERLSCLKKLSFGGSAVLKWNLGNINILNTLKYLQTLDLSYNKIRDIQILENQNGLQSLILRNNNISDIRILKYLTKLNSLDLSYNQFEDIQFLRNLTALNSLDLSSNKINDFQYLENLTGLQTLNLSNNNISDIRFLVKLTGLITLNISSNCIRFTGSLNKLNNLQTLNLRNNSISNINFLKHLPTLYSIDLGLNRIKNYSNLACLTRLHTLNLSDNHLSDIHFIEKLTCLNSLVLYNNKIDDIRFLDKLIGLQSLNLSFNQIYDISYLENLTELQSLNLRSNLISNIRNLENLSKLQKLDLAFNHINDILPLLPLLKKGLLISIDWGEKGSLIDINHISIPPESIFKAGKIAVINWFEQIKDGKAPLFEAKIMILGQGGAGKTTFAHLQLDTKFKVKPGKLVSTLGIVVHKGKIFKHIGLEHENIKAHLWDFGGQDIQKMLHQFFITENCLYVLVSDKRAENTNFDYWFQIINLLGPQSSVVVLENPIDITSANEDFALLKYRELFKELSISKVEVNLKETRGKDITKWKLLNETLQDKLSNLEIVNRPVPKKWSLIRDELDNLKPKKYISKDEFNTICSKPEIGLSTNQSDLCLFYLH